MSKVPASFLQCKDAAQRCKKMEALCKIRNHHKSEIRKVAVMLRILTDQERAEHRRELRHGLQPKGNNYKGKKDKPKVDGIGKGENKGLKGIVKWKGEKKRFALSAKWKGRKKKLNVQKSVEDLEYGFGRPKRWPGHCGQCLRRFLRGAGTTGGRPHDLSLCQKTKEAIAERPVWVKKTFGA